MQKILMVMLMYNIDNIFMTSRSLGKYYRDEMNDDANENIVDYNIINIKITKSRPFENKTKMIGNTPADNNVLNTEVVFSLKYLSNFWRSLILPDTNFAIELDLSWSKKCIISEISRVAPVAANPTAVPPTPAEPGTSTTGAIFQLNSTKRVSVSTLFINA